MPVDPHASVRISAFKWVPPFAKGHVRDLRARWALEEAGIPYAVRKLDAWPVSVCWPNLKLILRFCAKGLRICHTIRWRTWRDTELNERI